MKWREFIKEILRVAEELCGLRETGKGKDRQEVNGGTRKLGLQMQGRSVSWREGQEKSYIWKSIRDCKGRLKDG